MRLLGDLEAEREVGVTNRPGFEEAQDRIRALQSELEQARKELVQEKGWTKFWRDKVNDEGNVEADAQRYRDALERIATAGEGIPDWRAMANCARDALAGKGQT